MRRLPLAALAMLIALVPGTSSAPIDSLDAAARIEIWADGLGALRGLAVADDGTVYVADRAAGTVVRLGTDGARTVLADGVQRPVGLALDSSSRLLVAEELAAQVRVGRRVAGEVDGAVGLAHERRVGVGVGVDGHGRDAEVATGAEHPPGDLPAVGDQDGADHSRNTPNPPSLTPSTGTVWITDRQMPRIERVSRGSMTPSS